MLRYPFATNVADALNIIAHEDVIIDTAIHGSYNIRQLELQSHEELNLERTPCNDNESYNFDEVKTMLSNLYVIILHPSCSA